MHCGPLRLILDLFPKSDEGKGGSGSSSMPVKPSPCFFRLLTLLTQLTNILTAPPAEGEEQQSSPQGLSKEDERERKRVAQAEIEGDISLARACKALYRALRWVHDTDTEWFITKIAIAGLALPHIYPCHSQCHSITIKLVLTTTYTSFYPQPQRCARRPQRLSEIHQFKLHLHYNNRATDQPISE